MALSAIVWSTLELILGHVSRFLITIVLARLLTPEDFGVIAILSLFIGIAGALIDSGFTPVIIQRRDIDDADMSLVLLINLCISLFMCLVFVGISSYLASFYGVPILAPLTKLMALNLLISAIGSVHRAVLVKDLSFRLLMVIGASATLSSGTLAIYMAVSGYGLWALAAQTLTATSVNTILAWLFVKWRPSLILNRRSARRVSDLGGYLLASSILEILYTRIYALLIGKLYGPEELGYYVRADSTTALPMTVTNSILSRIALPLLAASSRDMDALRQNLRVSVQSAMIVNTPAMLGLAVVAESYIHVLFGEKWLPSVPLVQILCLSGLLMPLHILNVQSLIAVGHGRSILNLEIWKKIIGISILVSSSLYGVYGMAWGMVLASVTSLIVNAFYCGRVTGYRLRAQLSDALLPLSFGILMSLTVLFTSLVLDNIDVYTRLATEILIGITVYVTCIFLWKPTAYIVVRERVRKLRRGSV